MAGSRNRHGRPEGPKAKKHHKERGLISPKVKESVPGLTQEVVQPLRLSNTGSDVVRARLFRNIYAKLPEELFTYQEVTKEIPYSFVLGDRIVITQRQVPEDRTFIIDNVYFFATPIFGTGLVAPGAVEGAVQPFLEVGTIVPVEIDTTRRQPVSVAEDRAYFPFFNDRVGAREITFSLYVKRGRTVTVSYVNRVPTPVPLRTIGVRMEGWMIDSNAFEEILEQQQ